MKVEPINIKSDTKPVWKLDLYRDSNGNWFGAIQKVLQHDVFGRGESFCCTPTYTTPEEVVEEALRRSPPRNET